MRYKGAHGASSEAGSATNRWKARVIDALRPRRDGDAPDLATSHARSRLDGGVHVLGVWQLSAHSASQPHAHNHHMLLNPRDQRVAVRAGANEYRRVCRCLQPAWRWLHICWAPLRYGSAFPLATRRPLQRTGAARTYSALTSHRPHILYCGGISDKPFVTLLQTVGAVGYIAIAEPAIHKPPPSPAPPPFRPSQRSNTPTMCCCL